MRTWAQEKEYNARRAQQLGAEMEAAIEANDLRRFLAAYETSFRYMPKKQRSKYYIKMLERRVH